MVVDRIDSKPSGLGESGSQAEPRRAARVFALPGQLNTRDHGGRTIRKSRGLPDSNHQNIFSPERAVEAPSGLAPKGTLTSIVELP